MDGANSIIIKRLPGPGKSTWDVVVDKNIKRGIENKETLTFDVEAGKHSIQASVMFARSNQLFVDVPVGGDVSLECGFKAGIFYSILVAFVVAFMAVSFILLLPETESLKPYSLVIKLLFWAIYVGIISRPGRLLFIRQAG